MGLIAKQSIQGTIVTYLGVAVGVFTTFFVLTRFLTSEEIGLARVLVDAATLFVGLAQLGSNSSIVRFFPHFRNTAEHHHGFFFWAMLVPLIGFALFSLVFWACHEPLAAWFGEKSPLFVDYYYFVLPMAFFMLYQTIFETSASVLMHIVVPRFVREVVLRVGLLIIYLCYAFHWLSIDGFVLALCINYGIAAAINLIYLFSLERLSLRPDWLFLRQNPQLVRSYILYAAFLLVSALTSVLAPTLSSFFITSQMGLNYTGIFAIATYIAVMVSIPYRSVIAITQPELANTIKMGDTYNTTRLIHQAGNNLLLIGGFIFLAIWINIDLIFYILPNGETYAQARNVVLLLSIGQLMVAALNVYISALSYSRFYALSLINSLVLTVSALALNNYFIPRLGIDGAALATVLSDVIYYALVVLTASLALHVRPFSRKHALSLLLIVAIFALNALCNYIQHFAFSILNSQFSILHSAFSILKTLILLGGGIFIAYRLQLSTEIHALLHTIFLRRK
ncbi:MAG: oligosaccharide flippase family protein [Paludibacteraceae bacterium]|nr:oligosaccharide flippase family protein [Paludibacteraceae bacterium]